MAMTRLPPAVWRSACAILLAGILAMLIAITYRHPCRFDLSQDRESTLTGETLNRLALLGDDVRVIFPTIFQEGNPVDEIRSMVLWRARALLAEYIARQPHIRMHAQLDLKLAGNAEEWASLCKEHDLSPTQVNCFIFLSGDGRLRQVVGVDELADYDKPMDRVPRKLQVHEFRAQAAFTAALTRFINREMKRIYALQDHREAATEDTGPGGISTLRKKLEEVGVEIHPLSFRKEPKVPADCDLLLVIGAESPIDEEDRRRMEDYLRSGGRLLVALGPRRTGIEALLDGWKVRVQTGRVLERSIQGPTVKWDETVEVAEFNPLHPVTAQFRRGAFGVLLTDARALEMDQSSDDRAAQYLLRTSDQSFIDRNSNRQPDAEEAFGQAVVAGAVWRKRPDRPPPDYRHVDSRIVVIGDATPLLNLRFEERSHRDLVMNAVNWLMGRERQVAAGSTAWTERVLPWNEQIQAFLFWTPIFLFPGVVVCAGVFIYFLRRL